MIFFKNLIKSYLDKRIHRINTCLLREYDELYNFYNQKKYIDILLLGSSHGAYGLSAKVFSTKDESCFNLCTDSQDLYRSYELLIRSINHFKSIRKVILTYSLFSNGYNLDMVKSEIDKVYINDIIFKIKPRIKYSKKDIKYKLLGKSYLYFYPFLLNYNPCYRDKYGDKMGERVFCNDMEVFSRVKSHIKHNKRNNIENIYVEKIIETCKKNNIKLSVVIMPVRSDYRKESYNYGFYKDLFCDIINITSEYDVQLLSYFEYEIDNKYFGDFDHLTEEGAKFISNKILKDM